MIELHNITVQKSGRKLFNNFNFQIRDNEHWLIQGPNGGGKTILLELIANQISPAAGEVKYSFINTEDWQERYHQIRKFIRLIPAQALHHLLRGHHELFYQQRYYASGEEDFPKVRDLLSQDIHSGNLNFPASFNIDHLFDLELIRLSNGQLKKVIILQQLMRGIPKFLLLDYPFEGLDKESRRDLIDFIENIVSTFGLQLIIVDQHNELPNVINRRLVLQNFSVSCIENDFRVETKSPTAASHADKVAETSAGEMVVEMKDLTIKYGTTTIINRLNWQVRKGERWALTGRNGSGKTTLFSVINADHPLAYTQNVYLFGRKRGTGESIWDIKKKIAYLGPEQLHFINPPSLGLSAREFILGSVEVQDNDNFILIAERLGADRFIDLPLRWLSSGQLQVVLLIQCLLQHRELVLLDEPFQFLDPTRKQSVMQFLNDYLNTNSTLIMITHYEEDLVKWAKRLQL